MLLVTQAHVNSGRFPRPTQGVYLTSSLGAFAPPLAPYFVLPKLRSPINKVTTNYTLPKFVS